MEFRSPKSSVAVDLHETDLYQCSDSSDQAFSKLLYITGCPNTKRPEIMTRTQPGGGKLKLKTAVVGHGPKLDYLRTILELW